MVELSQGERIDYLFHSHLKIVQSDQVFTFSLDAVILARFVYVPIQKGRLIDLCSGTGAVPIILSERTKGDIYAVEIQPKLHEMANKSIEINQLGQRIHTICGNIKEAPQQFGHERFDIVTCNPPYFPPEKMKDKHHNQHVAIARHEIHTNLKEVVSISSQLLKQGGKAAFVHRPERLMALLFYMRENRLEPKRIMFVHPRDGKEANMVLVEGTKNGKEGLKILPPLMVYSELNEYTRELKDFCYGN